MSNHRGLAFSIKCNAMHSEQMNLDGEYFKSLSKDEQKKIIDGLNEKHEINIDCKADPSTELPKTKLKQTNIHENEDYKWKCTRLLKGGGMAPHGKLQLQVVATIKTGKWRVINGNKEVSVQVVEGYAMIPSNLTQEQRDKCAKQLRDRMNIEPNKSF